MLHISVEMGDVLRPEVGGRQRQRRRDAVGVVQKALCHHEGSQNERHYWQHVTVETQKIVLGSKQHRQAKQKTYIRQTQEFLYLEHFLQ